MEAEGRRSAYPAIGPAGEYELVSKTECQRGRELTEMGAYFARCGKSVMNLTRKSYASCAAATELFT